MFEVESVSADILRCLTVFTPVPRSLYNPLAHLLLLCCFALRCRTERSSPHPLLFGVPRQHSRIFKGKVFHGFAKLLKFLFLGSRDRALIIFSQECIKALLHSCINSVELRLNWLPH